MPGLVVRVIALSIALLVAPATQGLAADCELPPMRTNERPDPPGTPTRVTIAVAVADFLGVDDVNQRLELDLFVRIRWRDSRLADLEGCRFNVADVWTPDLLVHNSSQLRKDRRNARNQVIVGPDGAVRLLQRLTGTISSYHNLRAFPFDSHAFEIDISSLQIPESEMVLIADTEDTWIAERLNIEGWTVHGVSLTTKSVFARQLNRNLSVATLTIRAERDADYYFYRMVVMLVFVVGMSWAVFWVPPGRFEFQIGLGATSMLTTIAFSLSIAGHLPRLGYLTVLDKILIWSVLLIFLSMVEALTAGLLVLRDREAQARRLDMICRIAFPVLLFGGWLLMIAWT